MCGIAGYVGKDYDQANVEMMCALMASRGPDGAGQARFDLSDGFTLALGHRRLAIIDLTTGAQPMFSHDRRYCVVFNGEIYNYKELRTELETTGSKFLTHADTEVLIEAWRKWGSDSLFKLNGMFAFALYDRAEQTLELARDPFGEKPLFYTYDIEAKSSSFRFASQVAALIGLGSPEVSPEAVHDFLFWRYVPGPKTFFKGIHKLSPGTRLTWKKGKITHSRYWEAPYESLPPTPLNEQQAVNSFVEIFDESVRLRTRSDVPMGMFLSGGLDSTAILASLNRLGGSDINTFSIGYAGDEKSELSMASETAAYFNSIHTAVEFDSSHILDLLPKLSATRGAPVTEAADLPVYVMSSVASTRVKVVLSGEGSDEIFAGYPKHSAEHSQALQRIPRRFWAIAARAISVSPLARTDMMRRLQILFRVQQSATRDERLISWFAGIDVQTWTKLSKSSGNSLKCTGLPFMAYASATNLQRVLHFDQTSWLPDNLLERLDSMTMAASLEARAPFLDVNLARLSRLLPPELLIKNGVGKQVIRKALNDRIPDSVLTRRKNGFRMPVAKWFRSELREHFSDLLLAPGARILEYVRSAEVEGLYREHIEERRDNSKILWSLYSLEIFLRSIPMATAYRKD